MTLRIGWLSPFNDRTGVGTFSKAVTDAMPASHGGEGVDVTLVAPVADGLYPTRHRLIDIASASAGSGFYDLFDVLVFNIGNNTEHHEAIFQVLRNRPGVVICHDYVYQHFLATLVHGRDDCFLDYVALSARYGSPGALQAVRRSNITRQGGLRYAPWDTELSAAEPLAAPLLHLGSTLVVHSRFAESYAAAWFSGPILRLAMPFDQHPSRAARARPRLPFDPGARRVLVSFGHVQPTKCIDDVLRAIARSRRLRDEILYVVSGFSGNRAYLDLLRALVEENGLGEAVHFALDLPDSDLVDLSRAADGFVNLRYPNTEGASVSLIEQLITGQPVLVLNSGCYAELPDDSALKIAHSDGIPAITDALLRMLGPREVLAAIGRRGRDHAMSVDCAGYATALLDHLRRHGDLLRRRAAYTARCRIGAEARAETHEPEVGAWSAALSTARTSFDLLEQGRLHRDPGLLRELGPEQLADYAQAAILRDGLSQAGGVAIREYLRGADDPVIACRILDIARQAGIEDEPDALACLPEIVPHGDARFWTVVSALGMGALASICHHAFFGSLPAGAALPREGRRGDAMFLRLRLADDLAGRDATQLLAPARDLSGVLAWLRDADAGLGGDLLEPIPVGRKVAVGSSDQRRFLRLFGFFAPEADHAWTGSGQGLVYLRPPRGARSVTLSGHTLGRSDSSVSIAAEMTSLSRLARPAGQGGQLQFQIDLPDEEPATWSAPLCLSIRTSPCYTPAELGLSDDERPLGFCLQHVAVA